jgi:hypothetical protein
MQKVHALLYVENVCTNFVMCRWEVIYLTFNTRNTHSNILIVETLTKPPYKEAGSTSIRIDDR